MTPPKTCLRRPRRSQGYWHLSGRTYALTFLKKGIQIEKLETLEKARDTRETNAEPIGKGAFSSLITQFRLTLIAKILLGIVLLASPMLSFFS